MIIDEINKQVSIADSALQSITFKMQKVIIVIHRIAKADYQKEVVDTDMVGIEDLSEKDWIENRFSYCLSEEFMVD